MQVYVDGVPRAYDGQPTYYEIAQDTAQPGDDERLLADADGRLRELLHKAYEGAHITFYTARDTIGYETYRRSVVMLFMTALHNIGDGKSERGVLHFSIGSGFYITVRGMDRVDAEFAAAIENEMRRLVSLGLPFVKRTVSTNEAVRLFREQGRPEQAKLLRTRIASRVNLYTLDGYIDYYFGFLVHDTSVLKAFSLEPYKRGILLCLPDMKHPYEVSVCCLQDKLFRARIMGETRARQQGIGDVGDLNEKIIRGGGTDAVLMSEALQDAGISDIASSIVGKEGVRFVMIAGPSSSGKTTFSQKLCMHLMAKGLKPYYIGVDNYFVDRDKMKVGPDGKKDFEALSAVDVEKFNEDMTALLNGEKVPMPTFDFVEGRRVYRGDALKMDDSSILVIEGIHCLNDALSYALPRESKFKIYISALTQLGVDAHNRIASSDGRLLRRIIRDNRTRGYNAEATIEMWSKVRKGEEENIFPYQESADVIFNSALGYEIAALKVYAMPLLFQVEPDSPAFLEAKRLLKFLDFFVPIPSEEIPKDSILREFIGGGVFHL